MSCCSAFSSGSSYSTISTRVIGFSFEAGDQTFYLVVFHFISGTLISIFEGFLTILLLLFVFTHFMNLLTMEGNKILQ